MREENLAWFSREDAPPSWWRAALPWLFFECAIFGNLVPASLVPRWLGISVAMGLSALGLVGFVAMAVGIPIQVMRRRRARAARLQWMQDELAEFRSANRPT